MGITAYAKALETYRRAEGECLEAWGKMEYTPPLPAIEQAIIVALAARLLSNIRRDYSDTHGLGGMGAIEAVMKVLKFTQETPTDFIDRLGEDDEGGE